MYYNNLKTLNINDLKKHAVGLELGNCKQLKKEQIIKKISTELKNYDKYCKQESSKYITISKIDQIDGKNSVCYNVKKKYGRNIYVKKTFKKNKSGKKIIQEAKIQDIAFKLDVAPKIIEYNIIDNYIIMEKLDKHLISINILNKNLKLSKQQQHRIVEIFKLLSTEKIIHGDTHVFNFMLKNEKIYLIDYGNSRICNKKSEKDIFEYNLLSFIYPLYEKGNKLTYNYMLKYIDIDIRRTMGLSK